MPSLGGLGLHAQKREASSGGTASREGLLEKRWNVGRTGSECKFPRAVHADHLPRVLRDSPLRLPHPGIPDPQSLAGKLV